ncbi:MAG: hypothetical protein QGF62_06720 [Gammaproteobacteria bacterium]|jgi:hypothetical protein|nr:hypothetical protein [Gammaproteobacteria bacterium]
MKKRSILLLILLSAVLNTAAADAIDAGLAAAEAALAAAEAEVIADAALADLKAKLSAQTAADDTAAATDAAALRAISDASGAAGDVAAAEAAESDDAAAVAAATAVDIARTTSEAATLAAVEAAVIATQAAAAADAAAAALSARDAFEIDNTLESAGFVIVNSESPQNRTFHEQDDEDWIRFVVLEGEFYTVLVDQVGITTDPALTIYGISDQIADDVTIDRGGTGEGEVYAFQAEGDGLFFVQITNNEADDFGLTATYSLSASVENLSGSLAGPDLQIEQDTDYIRINQGTAISLGVDITNIGGQLSDNTARNLSLNTYLGSGMSLISELPNGCQFGDLIIGCDMEDLDAQQSNSFSFLVNAGSLGRRSIVSGIASYNDSARTSLQWDDRQSNNVDGIDFSIVERVNFGLNVRASKTSYALGEQFDFYLKMDTNDADQSLGPVDIYFNVAIPGGAVFYIVSLLGENTLVPTPLATNLQPFTLPDTHLIGFPFPDQIPIGEYNWSVIFVRPGGDVNQGTDWLSSMSFVHTVTPQ